jgi:DMSO/TMAO reductase YedYZ molybdopterin-dependent catalytic subunit
MIPARAGFLAGCVAGLLAVTTIYLGWFTGHVPAVALALWDRQMRLIPMAVFSFLIVRMKFAAKPAAFWGMLVILVVLFGLLGVVVARWARWRPGHLLTGTWVPTTAVLAILTLHPASMYLADRLAAEGATGDRSWVVVGALAAYGAVFAVSYTGLMLVLRRRAEVSPPGEVSRRQFLSRAVLVLLAAAGGTAAAQWLTTALRHGRVAAQSLVARITGLPAEITPNDRFYVVSKNPPGFDPIVDVTKWSLQVGGLVGHPVRLTADDVKAMPAVEQIQTLECISNEVGGDLISNARWKGVRLLDVLQRAGGPGPTAVRVTFRCADGYSEAFPLVDAMNPTTVLAYEMNGEPLPPRHGFPLRLLVPGLYGMKNPKWITRLDVVDYDFQGYWEAAGWTDDAVVKTTSTFAAPPRSVRTGQVGVGGVAYAGDRGVTAVEYSSDDGKTWRTAELAPALGAFSWVLWAAVWQPTAPGEYTLKVRARDGRGVLQTSQVTRTLPDGASGYHTIRVRVRP